MALATIEAQFPFLALFLTSLPCTLHCDFLSVLNVLPIRCSYHQDEALFHFISSHLSLMCSFYSA